VDDQGGARRPGGERGPGVAARRDPHARLHQHLRIRPAQATVIRLDDAPQGYHEFDKGAAKKSVIDPHGEVAKAA
jgi:hypothetical protein